MKSNKLVIGLLAHVDAGKTTLAESLLYLSGKIRKLGRVDHQDTFLDTYELERARGITIFSKQAELSIQDKNITLLDTPGHVDFSAEMERTLQVLDYAILIISGADGVQSHVETLWKLLKRYQIPVFLFVNKMDREGTDKTALLEELKKRLSENCVDFSAAQQDFYENLALCDEEVMDQYLESGILTKEQITDFIKRRKVFPCYFGSALKMQGIEEFMQGIYVYTDCKEYPEVFGARVFKISRDEKGTRLTHMKITGGSLKAKSMLAGQKQNGGSNDGQWQEKADQLRIYSGTAFELQQEVTAGTVCTVTGLTQTFAGEGLGIEETVNLPVLEPVLNYRLVVPENCIVHTLLQQLRQLEEEEPLLRIVWKEETGEIHAQLMGEVQIDVLKNMVKERFGVEVDFGSGSIVYKETLAEPVEGVGHFEPLRHYAEVHLLMEPAEPGSGLTFTSSCSEDVLDKNWQRLILTHLEEKKHKGVLTGSEITDMKITLVAGRAHQKHTEGGDFRQATYRAVRQGLKMGKSMLLEPVYEYRLEVPSDQVGRAMTDIQKMNGNFSGPEPAGEMCIITGTAPVATMQGYPLEVLAYTRGKGRLSCSLKGYEPCHNEEEVMEAIGYDSERDIENPTGSVFCAHGAGFVVDYDRVYDYMHLSGTPGKKHGEPETREGAAAREYDPEIHDEKELEAIFKRTYGDLKQTRKGWGKTVVHHDRKNAGHGRTDGSGMPGSSMAAQSGETTADDRDSRYPKGKSVATGSGKIAADDKRVRYPKGKSVATSSGETVADEKGVRYIKEKSHHQEKEYLLVDGYNIIFGWEELNQLAKADIGAARGRLMDILCNYQGYKKNVVILVFDAYKVEGNPGSSLEYHNIHVVYTKEAETADQYIEKTTHEIGRKHKVTVATSDALEQVIILGQGARRMSAQGLKEEVEAVNEEIRQELGERQTAGNKNYLLEHLPEHVAKEMEDIRLGKENSGN